MSWRSPLCGYAARFGVVTHPVSAVRPRPVRFEMGCFEIGDPKQIPIWFMHRDWQSYGAGDDLKLELWQDAYGLAFTFIPPPNAYSLVSGIAEGRYSECSVGFGAPPFGGSSFQSIELTQLREISICPEGACPGTAIWTSANERSHLPANARAVYDQWHTSRARHLVGIQQGATAVPAKALAPAAPPSAHLADIKAPTRNSGQRSPVIWAQEARGDKAERPDRAPPRFPFEIVNARLA